ncbi:AbiV family abortive infection protein [Aegicerativicinus sediminis]|uniref:AbiV family abortive infection protein n=1 Tax=Aegicerativicinus sediminis TaxID=2893202 RepID=UPI001E2A1E4C|nr:AbiV family abortive infection protein [Aegicerativicinus sediminis]
MTYEQTLSMFIDGLEKSRLNAINLKDDGDLLFQNNRYNRALALYQLSFEETGRFFLIHKLLLRHAFGFISDDQFSFDYIKKEYRKHDSRDDSTWKGIQDSIKIGTETMQKLLIHDEDPKDLLELINTFKKMKLRMAKARETFSSFPDYKNESLYVEFKGYQFNQPRIMKYQAETYQEKAQSGIDAMDFTKGIIDDFGGYGGLKKSVDQNEF